jgi:hypothetical protein
MLPWNMSVYFFCVYDRYNYGMNFSSGKLGA